MVNIFFITKEILKFFKAFSANSKKITKLTECEIVSQTMIDWMTDWRRNNGSFMKTSHIQSLANWQTARLATRILAIIEIVEIYRNLGHTHPYPCNWIYIRMDGMYVQYLPLYILCVYLHIINKQQQRQEIQIVLLWKYLNCNNHSPKTAYKCLVCKL